jgi:hypothetical protein
MKKTITTFRSGFLVAATFTLLAGNSIANNSGLNNAGTAKAVSQNGTSHSTTSKAAGDVYEGHVVAKEGAWCWFADPRALHYKNAGGTINSTYIGYIDVHGNIKATQYNFLTGKTNEVLIRSYFQPDDHDNPSFLVLPDERIMIFYSRHTDEACFYYRISKTPGDITSLGAEIKILTANNTTYPSPFILSDDPTHFYLCWRGINWHPTIARYTIPDAQDKVNVDWGPYQMVQSTGARPYCKYYSNGKDKIYLTYTTGHPDNEYPNYVYFNYIDINSLQLKDVTGTVLSTIASGPHSVNKTTYPASYPNAVVDNPTDQRDWVWQTALDKDGLPVIAMVQISNDKTTHNYYYAKWTGSTWRKTFLAYGGGHFHQTAGLELCYSGGMAIDDSIPNTVYCSVPVTGTSGSVYEIMKYTIAADGSIASTEQVTTNSTLNNVRPYIITNSGSSPLKLVWMHGNYYDWIVSSTRPLGYPTAIHSHFALPADSINLANGLMVNEDFSGTVTGTAHTTGGVLVSTKSTYATVATSSAPAFSISLTPYLYEGAYEGVILKMGSLTYGLNSVTLKPYLTIGDTTYNSTNLLGTSDVWQTQPRGTGGAWYTPTKLKYFNLTFTYEGDLLKIFRNGLIDQIVEATGLTLEDVTLGGFNGWVEDCRIYNRALTQGEVKKLTETSLAYTFNSNLSTEMELESLVLPTDIYTDVVLAAKSASGTTVTWASDNTTVVANSGLVTLPQTTTSVTLTATINAQSKTFNVNVWPRNIDNNMVFKYTFDAADVYTSNSTIYLNDKSGKGNDATIYGSAQVDGTLNLTANTAAGFSTNGYATAPEGIINNLRSCSFLARINPASLASAPRIFDFGSASSNSFFLRANAYTAGYKYNGGTTTLINAATSLTVGQEAKVAMTFDAKTKTTRIYLNGTETASSTAITYEPCQLSGIGANTRNYIGRTQWWDSGVASSNIDFNGTMDDMYMYNIALTATEIAQVQSIVTKVATLEKTAFSTYPNPTTDVISIQTNSGTQNSPYTIFNQLGKPVLTGTLADKITMVDLGQLHGGIYFIQIGTKRAPIVKVKNR